MLPNTTYYFLSNNVLAEWFEYDAGKNFLRYVSGDIKNSTFTTGADCYYRRFCMYSAYGTSYNNNISINYPSTVTTYSPYSNICLVTGWTGANVVRAGQDYLSGVTIEQGTYKLDTGEKQDYGTRVRTASSVLVPAGTYTMTCPDTFYQSYRVYAEDGTYIAAESSSDWMLPIKTITLSSPRRIALCYRLASGSNVSVTPSALTKHTLYKGYKTYRFSWESEAGTVCGGTLDVLAGVLTADYAIAEYDGSSDESWNIVVADTRAYIAVPDIKTPPTDQTLMGILSNEYKEGVYYSAQSQKPMICARANITQINVFDTRITSSTDWKAFLAANPLQVIYPLATPVEYTLTPAEVNLLLGTNNVWADTGDTTVTYKADIQKYIQKMIANALNS